MTTKRVVSRECAAFISKENGAYLISMSGPPTDDLTPDQLYFAASSLSTAKAIAKTRAAELEFTGPWVWVPIDNSATIMLECRWVDEWTMDTDEY